MPSQEALSRYGVALIIVCRFIPGGRTAVTFTCGLTSYPARRFVLGAGPAAVIWVLYAFFIGRLGGRVFEDNPRAGLLLALGVSAILAAAVEAVRRIRGHRAASRGLVTGAAQTEGGGSGPGWRRP